MGTPDVLRLLNQNLITEFKNFKWQIQYLEIVALVLKSVSMSYGVAESESDTRISKFKSVDLIWRIKKT